MLSLRGGGVDESFGLGLQQRLHTVVALGGEVHGHQPRRHDDSLDRPSQDEWHPRNFRCASRSMAAISNPGAFVEDAPWRGDFRFVHLISDVVHFSPVPSSWSESNSSSLSNFMSPSSFPKLPISQKLECKFASNVLGIPDRVWTLKCAVQFLIQFLLSNFFGHESSIFKRLLKNWTVVWDPKTENWIVNWIVNLTGPAQKLDGPCRKIGWALRKNWTAPENWTGPGMSQLGAQGAAALDLGVWFGVGRLGIKCHASGDIRGPAGAQLRA